MTTDVERAPRERGLRRALPPLAAALAASLVIFAAAAQDARGPAAPPEAAAVAPPLQPVVPSPAAAPPPEPAVRSGLFDALGHFFRDSAAQLGSRLQEARDSMGRWQGQANDVATGAAGAAKDAAGAIAGLPNARVITGRERCELAANGAPDCRAAADTVCRGKGFASGKSLDTEASHQCPPQAARETLLTGRAPTCPLETFVTRAVCQ